MRLALLGLTAIAIACAQTPPVTTAPPAAVRYVALGASDAVGVGAADPGTSAWPARIAARLPAGSAYANLGVSGSLATQAVSEQMPRAVTARPTVVTLWLAVNDLNAGVAPDDYTRTLGAIIDALVARTEAAVFVGNVPDLRPVPVYAEADKAALAAAIAAYNDAIARIAARHAGRVRVVDLHTGSAELVSTITVSADGFHPSDQGYALIADRFAAALRAAGIPLRG